MTAKQTPREAAAAEVEAHRAVVARWEAEEAAATAELKSLQERAGEEVLADESAAVRLSKSMAELRDRIDIASRAVAAATPRLEAAARAVVLAEADEVDAEQARAQARLDGFDARQQELLTALEEFSGLPWMVDRGDEPGSSVVIVSNAGGPREIAQSPRESLWRAVESAKRKAWALREIADGRDPHNELAVPFEGKRFEGIINGPDPREFYGSSTWGPEAVLPAPAYLRAMDAGMADEPVVGPTVAARA
ncbi:hypothetical protein EV645_3989 [Kribbella rubisoli]|uniref:Uncharacterized protein n=1 Tax=Kribbella rubisoli TaxID=3075929 RepID=A0A4Q7X0M6_9ACTN|nr:hypothetical protein [Kribbella rubisoli]RZU16424.1 hypothetical protein EV645_3989 [Kribbella rubisoli]